MKSEILKKLAELATELDANGFYSEADVVDEIIKNAWGAAPLPAGSGAGGLPMSGDSETAARLLKKQLQQFRAKDPEAAARLLKKQLQQFHAKHQKMQFPGAEIVGRTPEEKRKLQQQRAVNKIIKQLNTMGHKLPLTGQFDRNLAAVLNKYPGVWTRDIKQKATDIIARLQNVQQGMAKNVQQPEVTPAAPVAQKPGIGYKERGEIATKAYGLSGQLYNEIRIKNPKAAQTWGKGSIQVALMQALQSGMSEVQAKAYVRSQMGIL